MRKLAIYLAMSAMAWAILADAGVARGAPGDDGANGADTLRLNRTYRTVIKLELASGVTQIPLPPGGWVLLGLERSRHRKLGIPIVAGSLVRIEAGALAGIVQFKLNTEPSRMGWPAQGFCSTPSPLFMEFRANASFGKIDCWGLGRRQPRLERHKRKDGWAMIKRLKARKIAVPPVMISAEFRKSDRRKFLSLSYLFDPKRFKPVYGPVMPPVMPKGTTADIADWNGLKVRRDRRKTALVEGLKTWGWSWRLHVDAGFRGELTPARRPD